MKRTLKVLDLRW